MTRLASVPEATPDRLDALTGIRGIAAWLVVLYHIRLSLETLAPASVIAMFAKGYLAVDLFFVLSGFVLWHNYADRLADGGRAEARSFLWRRIARIWPLHAAILAAFVGLALLFLLTGRDVAGYPFAQLPLHVLLIQNWGITSELAWNHPAWSISTEMAAYLLFPLVVRCVRWERLPLAAQLALAAGLLAALYLLFALHGEKGLGGEIPRLGLWRCLIEFSLGNLVCMLWRRWRGRRHAAPCAAGVCLAALAGWLLTGAEAAFAPLCFCAGILALALDRGGIARALSTRAMVYLGEISYSTYLAHFLLFIVFKLLFVDASLQLGWPGAAGFLALLLAVSAGLYHGLEKPAQAWLNAHRPWDAPLRRPLSAD